MLKQESCIRFTNQRTKKINFFYKNIHKTCIYVAILNVSAFLTIITNELIKFNYVVETMYTRLFKTNQWEQQGKPNHKMVPE